MKRKIIRIDEDLCNGCGLCLPNCPEGALQMIDNKARLISDLFCDGLGACIGHCPQGAIHIEEREAEEYSESKVMENIVKQGPNTIQAHLEHLQDHGELAYHAQAVEFLKQRNIPVPAKPMAAPAAHSGCPGSRMLTLTPAANASATDAPQARMASQLKNWPIQLMLVPPRAPYFQGADLLLAADCVSFSYPEFHRDYLQNRVLIIACPKLDDTDYYLEKLTTIFQGNDIKSVTVLHMEVPCCFGLVQLVTQALAQAGKAIPTKRIKLSLQGEVMEEESLEKSLV
jgi:ferredoxin